ncbi:MAG: 2-succinyl-5-enolpyruvyl-6-hydroxy-3-cyclohexene-1-carboxylic-acid synthase [Bacteroidota bacterium]|nr:2-succinyl-5-enolpyruvyl-6-hydroxy-3-cyclohexene-1-carboxylic-acid synthase [Bacteroidota bacterium]
MILPYINEIATICAAHGISRAVISPGSRSAAISLAFENHPQIDVQVVADERSAAFMALGIAQQLKKPVAVICTSGSAGLNYAPAVAEAFYQEIPLLVITADRPPEWIDQYDGQTIRQTNLYGAHAKASFSLPVDLSHSDARWHANRLVNEAILCTLKYPMGPAHLNVPIREPFYPQANEKFEYPKARIIQRPTSHSHLLPEQWSALLTQWNDAEKRMVIIGQHEPDMKLTKALKALAEKGNVVIVNEVTANQHMVSGSLQKQDFFLQSDQLPEAPELLITLGNSLISKNLKQFLRKNPPRMHWHVRKGERLNDGLQHLSHTFDLSPDYFIEQLAKQGSSKSEGSFCLSWRQKEVHTQQRSKTFIERCGFGELKATAVCLESLPHNSLLHLANSMAVRYANFIGLSHHVEIYCNRGTSGIDGSNATAVGASLTTSKMVTLLTGDMAFLYDRNAFWHDQKLANLRIIVMNNAGGGIFGMIKGPRNQKSYEKLFQTHQPLTAALTAQQFGFEYTACTNQSELTSGLSTFFDSSSTAKVLEIFSEPLENERLLAEYKSYCLGL